jgi:hypothetical protein
MCKPDTAGKLLGHVKLGNRRAGRSPLPSAVHTVEMPMFVVAPEYLITRRKSLRQAAACREHGCPLGSGRR